MPKNRNPYAMAHSLRGPAGSGAHKDHRRDIIDEWWDPYSPQWMDLCELATPAPGDDNDVTTPHSGSIHKPLPRQFLLDRGTCCNTGCTNCPYKD